MFNKIKAIKDLRSQAKTMQSTLGSIHAEGKGAKGEVTITIDGNQEILEVNLSDEIMKDKERLQEGIKEAFAKAKKNIQGDMAKAMKEMGGMEEMFKNLGM